MNPDDTDNARKLPLAARAAQGLLLSEPDLEGSELCKLEHPTSRAAGAALGRAIATAIKFGDVVATVSASKILIERESYRNWRARCPESLLSPLSQIQKWLGATPAVEIIPPVENSLPETVAKLTESQQDKRDCQAIAAELWKECPGLTQADLLKHPRIKPYTQKWTGQNTIPSWLSTVDPRPKKSRKGRPRKPA